MPAEMVAGVGGAGGGSGPTPAVASPVGFDEVYFGSVPVHLVRVVKRHSLDIPCACTFLNSACSLAHSTFSHSHYYN